MQQNRTILFLVISLAILIAYPSFLKMIGIMPPEPQQQVTEPADIRPDAAPSAVVQAPVATAPVSTAYVSPAPRASAMTPDVAGNAPAGQSLPAQDIVVETDLYRAVLTTRGGVITHWTLKDYLDEDRKNPVELFRPPAGGGVRHPLAITVHDIPGFEQGIYTADRSRLDLSGDDMGTLKLTRVDPVTGASVTKLLTFHGDDYRVDMTVDTQRLATGYQLSVGSNFGIRQWSNNTIGFIGTANLIDGDVEREDIDDLTEPLVRRGDVVWTVTEDKYFLAGLLPQTPGTSVVSHAPAAEHVMTALDVPSAGTAEFILYVGPKEYDRLKALNADMQENIDFGWFMFGSWGFVRLLAEPMFVLLTILEGMVHNYGIAIILLTLLIKTAFIPLAHKSYKSMKAMQAIQPKVKAIQEKHKNNKEKLSRETMALYKEHKINPLGGCLPIFLQIPFFIAFFNILYTAIELRQTPFFGWIQDLSVKDPYYILPIVMGVSMFVQQKIQPSTLDPKQARIMMFLPILFTFFFMTFPAGLVLYWLMNNLFTILQQFITVRFLGKGGKGAAPADAATGGGGR